MATGIATSMDVSGARGDSSPLSEVLRDITRGGVAGAMAGVVVAGLGGRLVMRLATILHEDAVGAFTENGNRIGEITIGGTLALMGVGLVFGLLAGTVWVIVAPWLPGRGVARAVVAVPVALALGLPGLVQFTNPDFRLLGRDPAVVAMLIVLVGLMGFAIALLDGWLDGRLPHASAGRPRISATYVVVAALGLMLVLPIVVGALLVSDGYRAPIRAGLALAAVGLCTLAWWLLRLRGHAEPPRALTWAGRAGLLAATALGLLTALPHVRTAAGVP